MKATHSGLSALLTTLVSHSALAAPGDATVTVIHGITGQDLGLPPDLPVDVEVVGVGCALTNFTFGTISPRLALPPGAYDLNVRLSDGACGGAVAVAAAGVPFAADENATVIAHLDGQGAPTASKFSNDLSPSDAGEGRVQAHHTAAAPAVDLRFGLPRSAVRGFSGPFARFFRRLLRRPIARLNNVTNGQSGAVELPARNLEVRVAPAGGRVISRVPVAVPEGKTVFAYAVGSLASGSFTFIADIQDQTIPAKVTVIHGIPGQDLGLEPALPVDIEVVGVGCALTRVTFKDISSQLSLPAGSYDLRVRLSDGACGGAIAISASGVPFASGEDATVIAHLDASGAPTASKFVNDVSDPRDHRGRYIVHHTAAAPAVDLALRNFFGHRPIDLRGVTNGQSGGADVRQGLYFLSVAPAGGRPISFSFAPVRAEELNLVYAVGSLSNGTFEFITQRRRL